MPPSPGSLIETNFGLVYILQLSVKYGILAFYAVSRCAIFISSSYLERVTPFNVSTHCISIKLNDDDDQGQSLGI